LKVGDIIIFNAGQTIKFFYTLKNKMEHDCPICGKRIYNHKGACYSCREKMGIGVREKSESNPEATLMFFKWGFPVVLLIGGIANFDSGSFFRIATYVGGIWLFLSFLPIIKKLFFY